MKISYKVPLLASIVILVGFSILTFVLYTVERDSLYETVTKSALESSQAVSNQVTGWLEKKLALIDLMSGYIAEDYSVEKIQEVMANPLLKNEFSLIFGCLEEDGKPLSNSSSWFPGETWDGRKRSWYLQGQKSVYAVFTPPYVDSATGRLLLSAVGRIEDKTAFKGVFGGDIESSTVARVVNSINFNKKGYVFLLDKNGAVISHPTESFNGKTITTIFPNIAKPAVKKKFIDATFQGKDMLVKFIPVKLQKRDTDWLIAVVLNKGKILKEADQVKSIAIIATILSTLAASLVLYFTMANLLLNPLKEFAEATKQISLGKLSTKIKNTERNDEVGLLSKNFNGFIEKLQAIISEVKNGTVSLASSSSHLTNVSDSLSEVAGQAAEQATSVASATKEMSQNFHNIAAAMEQSSTGVATVATASEEMTSTIDEISAQTSRAKEISGKAVARFSKTKEKMDVLGQAASEISTVTEVITQISGQTDLLALNATIEAARAGETGKGFAVVASEIKELAKQTAEATIDIKNKISEVQSTTDSTLVDMSDIRGVVQEVNGIILTIASAIEQQTGAALEISSNSAQLATGITEINGSISQSSVMVNEIAGDANKMSTAASDVHKNGRTVATSARELQELAGRLQKLVSHFTV
ncbi:MAG: chemotaxis protein [Gammaproteobacteria bacterium]|nr:MAG: chemotaxis protein [Gammaproteobacteria bacterium]